MPKPDNKLTGYAQALKARGLYPLKPATPWRDRKPNRERPTATAYLVVPAFAGDDGSGRPLPPQIAQHSAAIQVIDVNTQAPVTVPVAGCTYTLQCVVSNRGAVGSYAGVAEFYVAPPAVLDAWAAGGARPAPLGYAGVMVPPGGSARVTCQHRWTVIDPASAILVVVYDPLVDKPAIRYDGAADRHVGRRDAIPDFTGTYLGLERFANNPASAAYQLKVVIAQTGGTAAISIYSQVGGQLPAVPQLSGTAQVTGASFVFNCSELLGGQPFTSNTMTFSLTQPNLLHYTQHRHFLAPGDTRPDQDMVSDLPRV
jgi:hypothetical protein